MPEHDTPAEWVEAEIQPADYGRRERLLVDVIDPLIHETLSGRIDAWHYFWEPTLRFRVHWQQPIQAGSYALLASALDDARDGGKLADWTVASHGRVGQVYQGEAEKFGDDIWPYMYQHWTTGCELALALLKRDPDNVLTEFSTDHEDNVLREFHWVHVVHLFSNPLGLFHLDEGRWSLRHASRVLAIANNQGDPIARDQQVVGVLQAIAAASGELDAKVRSLREGSREG
ncbi:MAG: hypothetical protein JO345_22465 [Streptosporangiaceae bacterium]|nr:hypothetical protein [Streptosporangiaceae bacterium]